MTGPVTLRSALFHCQQAAEKSLKAFLTWHQKPFPKTHNLTVLSGSCAEIDASLSAEVAPSLALTRFAVAMRYPGEIEQPSIDEARAEGSQENSVIRRCAGFPFAICNSH